jgi:hypothetical protein
MIRALALLCLALGCLCARSTTDQAREAGAGPDSLTRSPEVVSGYGRVVKVELEGGFWGIVAENGARYDPAHLPDSLRIDSLRVFFEASIRGDAAGIHMWGTLVELLEIRPAPPGT